jgi:hypothetical protein
MSETASALPEYAPQGPPEEHMFEDLAHRGHDVQPRRGAQGSSARRSAVGGAWRSSTAAASSPVGTVSARLRQYTRMQLDVLHGGLTGFGYGWNGSRASCGQRRQADVDALAHL